MKRLTGVLALLALISAAIFWLASLDITTLTPVEKTGHEQTAEKRVQDMQGSMLLGSGPDVLRLISKRYQDIAVKSVPCVVHVRSIQGQKEQSLILQSETISDYYSSQLGIETENEGTGIFINDQGLILTPLHVLLSAVAVQVRTWDGKTYQAELVSADVGTDLAILKIPLSGTRAIRWGDSASLGLGEFLVLVGADSRMNGRICQGLVSSFARMPLVLDEGYFGQYSLIDASSTSPRSGWLVLNLEGEMVGLLGQSTASIYRSQGEYVSLESNQVRQVAERLAEGRVIQRSYAGLHLQQLTMDLDASRRKKVSSGALVSDVVSGSPAELAGIQPGDVVLKIGSSAVSQYVQVRSLVAGLPRDKEVLFQVDRNGELLTLPLKPSAHPMQLVAMRNQEVQMRNGVAASAFSPLDGLTVEESLEQSGAPRGTVQAKRLVISSVDYRQVIPSIPIEAGMHILEVDGQPVAGREAFELLKEQLQDRTVVALRVDHMGKKRYITLRPAF